MDPKYYLNYPVPERIAYLLEDKNIDYIYKVLEKYTQLSVENLKQKYSIKCNFIRQLIYIKGDRKDIAILFYLLSGQGLKFESVTDTSLDTRVGLFLNALK